MGALRRPQRVPSCRPSARAKAARGGFAIDFLVASVTDLSALSGPFDYALDIGCLHALKAEDRMRYAVNLSRLLRPQAWYMLYAWLPRPWEGGVAGISTEEVESLLRADFSKVRTATGAGNAYRYLSTGMYLYGQIQVSLRLGCATFSREGAT